MPELPEASATTDVRAFDRPIVIVPVFALIASMGGLFGSFTVNANLLVLAVGGTMVWLGVSGRAGRRTAVTRLPLGALWWLVPVLVIGLTELYSFLHASRGDYPTISLLFDPVLERYLPRAAGYFGWLAGFWALVRR